MRLLHLVIVLLLSAGLVACGTIPSDNSPPTVTIMASGHVAAQATSAELSGSIGGEIHLSGSLSTDPEGDALSFQWTLTTSPPSSNVARALSAAAIVFTPDAIGTFTFTLRVSDATGAFTERTVTITVNQPVPNQALVVTPTFTALPTVLPTQGIAVGDAVVLDATDSRDPDGAELMVTSTLIERPARSATVLSSNGRVARFITDTQGLYRVVARARDSSGVATETTYVFDAQITAANTIVIAKTMPQVANQDSAHASVGFNVVLDGSDSVDPGGGTVTRTWTFASRPPFSGAQLSNTSGSATQFAPDVLGNYAVQLRVTNAAGMSNDFLTTVVVDNTQPIADITAVAPPNALPPGAIVGVPVNTPVMLHGGASSDADGDLLTYTWSVVAAPSRSSAAPMTPGLVDTRFTPDVIGRYVVRLRVTDPAGVFSERAVTIDAGNAAPIAVVNRNRMNVVAGATVTVSAAQSFDDDHDPLTYSWVIPVAPPFSAATLVTAPTPDFSFVADMPGLYLASVTVTDGRSSKVSRIVVQALPVTSDSVVLPFVPIDARYDKQLDKMLLVTRNPDALQIVDPRSGQIENVPLPFPVKSFSLSPDGSLAAVLHDGRVSLVDLELAQVLQSSFTRGSHTDVFLQNDGVAYLIGATDDQSNRLEVRIIDTRRGTILPNPALLGGSIFGTQRGVFADRKNKVLFSSVDAAPQGISTFTIDPVHHTVVAVNDMWYSSRIRIGAEFYLSEDQELLLTSTGNIFDVDTREFVGSLGLTGELASLTQSARNEEVLLLQRTSLSFGRFAYRSVYKRFSGPLLQADPDIALPTIHGQQSFGIGIFHSADDDAVVLVQTGGAEALAPGLRYHLIVR